MVRPARPLSTFLAITLFSGLAGCTTVGPDYQTPANAIARTSAAFAPFMGVRQAPAFSAQPLPAHWWRLFETPSLNALVESALAHNTDLRMTRANLEKVQAQLQDARALAQPTLALDGDPSYGHTSGVQAAQPDHRPPDRFSYSAGATVSYAVDLFGQIRRADEAAQDDVRAAQAAVEAARVAVAAETTRAYVDACGAGMQLEQAQHAVDVQAESLSVTQLLSSAGRGTPLDIARAQAQWQHLKAARPPLQAQRRIALYRLATLTGQPPSAFPQALAECTVLPRMASVIPVGDGAALLARRPDIRQAEHQLAAATARIGVATADLYPKISLGLSSVSAGPATRVGEPGTFSWRLGPLISWTIPNTGAARARIAQAEASSRAAAAHFDGVVLNALRETESALTQYARQQDRDADLSASCEASEQAAQLARRLFKHGKTDYLTVLDAERTLAQSASARAASRATLVDRQIAIFMALGGGWAP